MKQIYFIALFSLSFYGYSQELCLVTCDYQTGENNLIMWEPFVDNTNLDSVFIYRKSDGESVFSKIGSTKVGESTVFTDNDVDTKINNWYRMAVLDSNGVVGTVSTWHKPMSLDYSGSGEFVWSSYEREDLVEPFYVGVLVDETGLGIYYTAAGQLATSGTNTWIDPNFTTRPTGTKYYFTADVTSCNIQTKANINTSRSNIKQQIATGALGLTEIGSMSLVVQLFPNPASTSITLGLNFTPTDATYSIVDLSGKIIQSGIISKKETMINIADFSSGYYTLVLKEKDKTFIKNFVK